MRIEVWEPPEPTPEPEKVLRLRLRQCDRSGELWAVDEGGASPRKGSHVAILSRNGLTRIRHVDPDLGFPLDDKGRVKLVGE